MTEQDSTANTYIEIANKNYATLVEAFSQYNQRMLSYGKSLFEIVSRPYTSTAVENALHENFERANQIVELTVNELQTAGTHAATVSNELASNNAKLQETAMESSRGLVRTFISNANYVRDTTQEQIQNFTKRAEEIQARTVSAN